MSTGKRERAAMVYATIASCADAASAAPATATLTKMRDGDTWARIIRLSERDNRLSSRRARPRLEESAVGPPPRLGDHGLRPSALSRRATLRRRLRAARRGARLGRAYVGGAFAPRSLSILPRRRGGRPRPHATRRRPVVVRAEYADVLFSAAVLRAHGARRARARRSHHPLPCALDALVRRATSGVLGARSPCDSALRRACGVLVCRESILGFARRRVVVQSPPRRVGDVRVRRALGARAVAARGLAPRSMDCAHGDHPRAAWRRVWTAGLRVRRCVRAVRVKAGSLRGDGRRGRRALSPRPDRARIRDARRVDLSRSAPRAGALAVSRPVSQTQSCRRGARWRTPCVADGFVASCHCRTCDHGQGDCTSYARVALGGLARSRACRSR